MTTIKVEDSRNWQQITLAEAIAAYKEEFDFKPYNDFLSVFKKVAYLDKAACFDRLSTCVVLSGGLIADRNINAALIAHKVKGKPQYGCSPLYSLAIFLEPNFHSDVKTEGAGIKKSDLFDDLDLLVSGKKVRLGSDFPLQWELAGETTGATIKGLDNLTKENAATGQPVSYIINDSTLDEITMALKRQLQDQLVLRK